MSEKKFIGIQRVGWILVVAVIPALVVSMGAAIYAAPINRVIQFSLYFLPVPLLLSALGILLFQKNWARMLSIILSIIISLATIFSAGALVQYESLFSDLAPMHIILAVISIITALIFIGVIIYLTRPKVKVQFK